MPRLSLVDRARAIGQIQAASTTKWIVEFVSGIGQENVCLASMQSRNEHNWTVMGPAGENCSCHSHHRHPLQDFRQIVIDEWNAIPQQRVQRLISRLLLRLLLRPLVVLPATNVVHVLNEV